MNERTRQSVRHYLVRKSTKGFAILLDASAPTDMRFSWTALAVKEPKTWVSDPVTLPPPPPSEPEPQVETTEEPPATEDAPIEEEAPPVPEEPLAVQE